MVPSGKGGLGVFVKVCYKPDHVRFKTTILPIDFHETSSVPHCPANIPAHGVEQVLLCLNLDLTDPLTGVLETLDFYLDSYASHYALVCSLEHVERKTDEPFSHGSIIP